MASREISGALLRTCFGKVRKGVTPAKLLNDVLEELATVTRDIDKTGDMDSHYYYEGMSDAFQMVAFWIADHKKDKQELRELLLG